MGINYSAKLNALKHGSNNLKCPYCGSETLAVDKQSLCSWCECAVYKSPEELSKLDNARFEKLNLAQQNLSGKNYGLAAEIYSELYTRTKEMGFLYTGALALIAQSNQETSKINYELPGFMEENILHRNAAAALYSDARRLLSSIAYKSPIAKAVTADQQHIAFLSMIKLGNLKAASYLVEKWTTDIYFMKYDQMLLEIHRGEFGNAFKLSEWLVDSNMSPLNVFYYTAFCLMKMGRNKEAKALLSTLGASLKTERLSDLQEVIAGRLA